MAYATVCTPFICRTFNALSDTVTGMAAVHAAGEVRLILAVWSSTSVLSVRRAAARGGREAERQGR